MTALIAKLKETLTSGGEVDAQIAERMAKLAEERNAPLRPRKTELH